MFRIPFVNSLKERNIVIRNIKQTKTSKNFVKRKQNRRS